jgi:hypothetical protein
VKVRGKVWKEDMLWLGKVYIVGREHVAIALPRDSFADAVAEVTADVRKTLKAVRL